MARVSLSDLTPGLRALRQFDRSSLPGDIAAGLLVAALAIPQALGYAVVAGVPVQVGLYSIPPALLAYAIFGSSRVLFMGPVSTVSVLSGSVVGVLAAGDTARAIGLTSALSIMAGVVLIAVGLFRLGWVAQFLSEPIVTGFVTGLVVLIVAGEIPTLLGLPAPSGALLDRLWAIAQSVGKAQPTTVLVGAAALALLFAGSKLLPRLPWSLLAIVGGIAASHLLNLKGMGVGVVGIVPDGVPLPKLPVLGLSDLPNLITGGFALAAVGIAEGLAAANTFAPKGEGEPLQDNAEFIANGVGDIASGMFGGMGVGGSLSKTAAVVRSGGRSQVFGLAAAVIAVLVLLLAAGLLTPLPRTVLSAVVVHAVWGLVHPRKFVHYKAIRRNDFVGSLAALIGVLLAGPLNGLLIAIAQSLLGLVYRSMQVHIDEIGKVPGEKAAWGSIANDPARVTVAGICVLRPDGPLFWANCAQVIRRLDTLVARRAGTRAIILDLETTNQLDTTTAEQLIEFVHTMRARGVEVYLVRVFGNVRGVLERSGVLDMLGDNRLWHSISAGVKAAKADIAERRRHEHDIDPFWDPYEDAAEDAWLGDEGPERIFTRPVDSDDDEHVRRGLDHFLDDLAAVEGRDRSDVPLAGSAEEAAAPAMVGAPVGAVGPDPAVDGERTDGGPAPAEPRKAGKKHHHDH